MPSEPTPAERAPINVLDLADLMDHCADSDAQWDAADVCDALAELIDRHAGWNTCQDHGLHSARKPACPWCD